MSAQPHSTPPTHRVLQAITLLLLCAPLAAGGWWVWQKHQWAQQQLAQLEPRHARLLGLQASKDSLAQAETAAKAQLARQVYPATLDAAQAGNDAQQRIRTLFADSKLDIGSIQVLPPKEQKSFDRIGVVLRVEGDLVGMQNALTLLETQSPTVWVEAAAVQTIGAVKPKSTQRLGGQFTLFVLRSRS
ncbi:MAG: type II secretion system protein GspM [Burkholderiaceae bacterium]